jgi:hypothetical protein
MLLLYVFLVMNLLLVQSQNFYEGAAYAQPMFLDVSRLSIASITYNPTHVHSQWVTRLFGNEAIFYNRSEDIKSPKPVTTQEKVLRSENFHKKFRLPPEYSLPTCSIEMLGYAVVTEEPPLSFAYSVNDPSIGKADLTFLLNEDDFLRMDQPSELRSRSSGTKEPLERENWQCLYRAMYDNTGILNNLKLRPHHHWPVFIYCPAPNYDNSCINLVNTYRLKLKKIMAKELQKKFRINEKDFTEFTAGSAGNNPKSSLAVEVSGWRRRLQESRQFPRLINALNAMTNLQLMGLRSFYITPGYGINRDFLMKTFKGYLGVEEIVFPRKPTLTQEMMTTAKKGGDEGEELFLNENYPSNDRTEQKKAAGAFVFPSIFLSAKLSFHFHETTGTTWTNHLEIDLLNDARKTRSEELAVCSIIPYVSSDDVKAEINGAMIYDYIRYYTKLGYKIMLFDRNGRHSDSIFHSSYAARTSKEFGSFENVLYYNYTILQLLKGYPIDVKYENDIGLSPAVVYTDYDKRYTYTYCRFALKHLYGIENVLINDFDEFLYCPRGTANAQKQKEYQKSYFRHLRKNGIEQLFMKQRVIVSKEPDLKECFQRQVDITKTPSKLTQNVSIFECLAPFEYEIKSFFDKTLHFAHVCPYTHYHYTSYLRYFDCFANTYLTATKKKRLYAKNGCSMVHLTTRPQTYNRTVPKVYGDSFKSQVNEIHQLLNS